MDKQSILMAVPTFLFSAILIAFVIWNVYLSFTNYSIFQKIPQFAGLYSYYKTLTPPFFNSLIHSFELSVALVVFGNLLGLLFACLIYFVRLERLRTIYLSLMIYPLAISMAANGLIWLWLFNPTIGLNFLLSSLHVPVYPWLTSPSSAFPSMIVVSTWAYTGFALLFYLAAFLGVDKSIIESARLDGSGPFRIVTRILIPNSVNAFIISSIILFLFSFRIFTLPYMLSGGPYNSLLQTLVVYMYVQFSTEFFARSAVVGVIITIIALAVVIPYALYGMKRWIRHE